MIKLTENELNRLRDISIHDILGLTNNGRHIAISCPHGNSDSTPSCYIYNDNGFHCFSCGRHGNNALDFMMSIEGSFIKSCEELIKYI